MSEEANSRQVGGQHYQVDGEQHWDRIWRLYGRGYFVGNITKYVERYHLKNGVEDLKKAQHYIQKLIELEQASLPSQADDITPVRTPVKAAYTPAVQDILLSRTGSIAGPGYVDQD